MFSVQAFLDQEHRPMLQSVRTQGEAEYISGVNSEVDAPAQVTVQRQQEVVAGKGGSFEFVVKGKLCGLMRLRAL